MDAFYASVEQRERPELRGKPVIVGGPPDSRGVVASASYEARRYQVRSAMSSAKASRLCPQAVFVSPRFGLYKEASRVLQGIFREVTDLVEPLALDEAYLDVTLNKLHEPSATKIARYLQSRIRGQLSLSASAGVGPNKFLAKLASEMKKPGGLVVVSPDRVDEIVKELPVEKLWGIGPATAQKLHAQGWSTTADLRRISVESLVSLLGKQGAFIHGLAFGIDPRPVNADRTIKSRGAEVTFERDTLDTAELEKHLLRLATRVCTEMSQKDTQGRHVCLKLRYRDFTSITRSRTLPFPTNETAVVFDVARELLLRSTEAGKTPVRLVGVSVSGFDALESDAQLLLPL